MLTSRAKRIAFQILRALVLGYLALFLILWAWQSTFIYFPTRQPEARMLQEAERREVEPWRDEQGAIIGWRSPPKPGRRAANRMLVFHGNAGHALMRTHFIGGFERLGDGTLWEVFVFEYPGFGARPGSPSQQSFLEAIGPALALLRKDDSRPIFLVGESIGSGPASTSAALESNHVAGLFLITPYTTLPDVAAFHFPWMPVRWIMRDRWDNVGALTPWKKPVAMMVAEKDETIPPAQAHKLFAALPGPKKIWEMKGAGHNEIPFHFAEAWWQEVSNFLLQPR